jgi:hypothetical protein
MAKQRQVRIEQGLPQNLMEDMQERTNEQLETETKHRSIALAILGARAAERYDAAAARTYFQRAIAASRPQERMQIRRMADASLALAERRADDLKHAVEKLGGEAPSGRALMGLRLMGLIVPPPGAGILLKVRGFGVVALIVIVLLAAGLGIVELFGTIFFGGVGLAPGLLLGLIVDGVALSVLAYFGRRRQKAARPGAAKAAVGPAKPSLAARFSPKGSAKGAADAKTSTDARGSARGTTEAKRPARGSTDARSPARGASAAKGSGVRPRPPANGSGSGSGSGKPASGSASARRGGQARGATGTTKGAAPAKPAKGAAPPAKKSPPARPKRPSR